MRDNSCLPSNFFYVIDEAHHFAAIIREQLVTQIGEKSFDDVFNFFDCRFICCNSTASVCMIYYNRNVWNGGV